MSQAPAAVQMPLACPPSRHYPVTHMDVRVIRILPLLLLLFSAGCSVFDSAPPERSLPSDRSVAGTARSQIGAPYVSGGNHPSKGFDCSGLVQWCYLENGYKLPRRTEDLLKVGVPVKKSELLPGDLVFFNVSRKRWGLHVGVYSGRGRFIHSPTPGSRVREEDLHMKYWVRTYIGARRIVNGQ